jgi:hypothetical protein
MEFIRTILGFIAIVLLGLCIAIITLSLNGCKTTSDHYTQQSNIDPRKQVIYDSDGNERGYLQKSYIDPRKTIQYDKNGKRKGYWQKSYIDPRKTVFHKD